MKKAIGLIAAVVALTTAVAAQRGREGSQPAPQSGPQGGAPAGGAQPPGRGTYQPTTWWGDDMFPKWPYPAGDAVYATLGTDNGRHRIVTKATHPFHRADGSLDVPIV